MTNVPEPFEIAPMTLASPVTVTSLVIEMDVCVDR